MAIIACYSKLSDDFTPACEGRSYTFRGVKAKQFNFFSFLLFCHSLSLSLSRTHARKLSLSLYFPHTLSHRLGFLSHPKVWVEDRLGLSSAMKRSSFWLLHQIVGRKYTRIIINNNNSNNYIISICVWCVCLKIKICL